MNESISTALLVLTVGMITVFVILGLVVLTGKVLIRIINRVTPDKSPQKKVARKSPSPTFKPQKLSAIIAAVEISTYGKGKIIQIEKMS